MAIWKIRGGGGGGGGGGAAAPQPPASYAYDSNIMTIVTLIVRIIRD